MKLTQADIECAKQAVRQAINETGYGSWVSDDHCRDLAAKVLRKVWNRRMALPDGHEDRWSR